MTDQQTDTPADTPETRLARAIAGAKEDQIPTLERALKAYAPQQQRDILKLSRVLKKRRNGIKGSSSCVGLPRRLR